MGGMQDRTGRHTIKQFAHVRIAHPRHLAYNMTGTVVRTDPTVRKVWVALPDGRVVSAGHRSVEVLVPNQQRKVK